jgi:CBS domain-containing protein
MALTTSQKTGSRSRLVLEADTAADLMTSNPVSIRDTATVQEAAALLTDKGISAAPVINEVGYPIGVLSRTDLIIHDREKVEYLVPLGEEQASPPASGYVSERQRSGYQVVNVDRTQVREIMTPVVFAVNPETPANRVIAEMLAMNVHRLFVVDNSGVLVGVISPMDILRCLRGEAD